MSIALAHAKAETIQLLRVPAFAIPIIVFPVIAILAFGRQVVDGEPDRLLAGFAAMAVLGVTFFQFGVAVATSRLFTWETYLRTLPVGGGARLLGKVLSGLGFATVSVVAVCLAGNAVFDASPSPLRAAGLVAALLLGCIPFALLGIALGYWLPPRAALPVANLAFLPFAIAGTFWKRAPDDLPRVADVAWQLVPTRSWMEVLDSVATGDSRLPLHHVATLVGWTVVFGGLAWWGYRRDEGERFR